MSHASLLHPQAVKDAARLYSWYRFGGEDGALHGEGDEEAAPAGMEDDGTGGDVGNDEDDEDDEGNGMAGAGAGAGAGPAMPPQAAPAQPQQPAALPAVPYQQPFNPAAIAAAIYYQQQYVAQQQHHHQQHQQQQQGAEDTGLSDHEG